MRILELQTEQGNRIAAGTVKRLVGERNHRLEEWQTRWDEIRDALDAILIERGYELGEYVDPETGAVAGGSTGFIVRDYKGKDADVPVYRIDPGILSMVRGLLEVAKRAAQELGQWNQKHLHILEEEEQPDLTKLTDEELQTWLRLWDKAAAKGAKVIQ